MMERWNETTKADKKQKTPGTGERNRIDQEEKEREEESMEGRGKSRRRSPYRVWKRRGSALLAVLLTLSLMLGDISGLSRVVMAGQGTVREEFRIHRENILKAAEEAIENGEPLSEPLAITSEEEKTEEKYQEILPADGSVYEIFPDIEQVKEVDSLELRIFIRLAEGADPASYTLTGDETLVFLYVNGGDVTAEGRVNIDGYVSEFTKVAAFESEEEPMQPGGTTGAAPGNGAAGSGNGSGNGAAGGGNAGNGTETAESESSESGSMDPEDSAADLDGETEAESEEAGDEASEDGMSPEETLPAETQEPSQELESSAAEETEETEAAEQPSGQTPDDETPGDQTDGSEADGTASDENTAEAGTGSADEDKETAGNTENSGAEDNGTDNESNVNESDAADDASEGNEGSAEDNSQADPADTENENAEADKEDGAEPEKSDTAENADSNAADEDNEAGSTVTLSLRNVQKVAASLASPSEAEIPEADESQEEQEESEADEEDSYYEDNGDPVDEEDAAEAEDEEDIFKKTHDLKGRKYDEAVLDETVTVRAFAAGMEDAGFNREDLLEGTHQLTYTVAEGEARLIYTPEYVRDEAVVTFGIIPAEGMEVYQVTANGEALAETEETAAIASASQAKRAKASSSDADYDEERAVYYQIPQVLEDQTVEIQVVEEGYSDHPAFLQSRTVNGVTVTVSAEEGILPAGTELSVEEVTEQVADAVAEKVEEEAGKDSNSAAEEQTESETGDSLSVTQVLAYDINLMLDGKKLNNDWGETNVVTVKFSGERIEEASKDAEKIEIATLETPTKTVEAALGGTEEMPVVENLTAEDIQIKTEGRQAIDISGDSSVQEIETEVSHFSVYTITFSGSKADYQIYIEDENGEGIGKRADIDDVDLCNKDDSSPIKTAISIIRGNYFLRNNEYYFHNAYVESRDGTKYTLESIYTQDGNICYRYQQPFGGKYEGRIDRDDSNPKIHFVFTQDNTVTFSANDGEFPGGSETYTAKLVSNTNPVVEGWPSDPTLTGAAFSGWVYKDAEFKENTYACAGTTIYALYNTNLPDRKENKDAVNADAGKVTAKKDATWVNYDEGIARIDFTVSGIPEEGGIDVVIVLDKSGSMSYRLSNDHFPERMKEESGARAAAEAIIDSLLTENGNNRVAYVPFSAYRQLVNDANTGDVGYSPQNHTESYVGFQTYASETQDHYLEYAINATDAYGGTNYTEGLETAANIIGQNPSRPTYIIFISDGKPNTKYDEHGRAVNAAQELKEKGVTIYSVGIQLQDGDKGTIQTICNQPSSQYYKDVGNMSDLLKTLQGIVDGLKKVGTDGRFEDEISEYFTPLSSAELDEYDLENSQGVAVNEDKVVTITVGDIPVAEKEYFVYVKINEANKTPTDKKTYKTNKDVKFYYTDTETKPQTIAKDQIGDPDLDRYGASLAFTKTLASGGTEYSKVKFSLYKAVWDEANGTWDYAKDQQGNLLAPLVSEISVDGSSHILNLPPLGYGNYLLKETATADGYQLLEEPILIQVKVEPLSQTGYGWLGTKESVVSVNVNGENINLNSGKGTWNITNVKLPELPETGGPGYIMAERFGWILLLLAMFGTEIQIWGRNKRKEE